MQTSILPKGLLGRWSVGLVSVFLGVLLSGCGSWRFSRVSDHSSPGRMRLHAVYSLELASGLYVWLYILLSLNLTNRLSRV